MSPIVLLVLILLVPLVIISLRIALTLTGWLISLLFLVAVIVMVHLLLAARVDPLIFGRCAERCPATSGDAGRAGEIIPRREGSRIPAR